MSGVSARHGGHHVAQKFRIVTLPAVAATASGCRERHARIGGAADPTGALPAFDAVPRKRSGAEGGENGDEGKNAHRIYFVTAPPLSPRA